MIKIQKARVLVTWITLSGAKAKRGILIEKRHTGQNVRGRAYSERVSPVMYRLWIDWGAS